MEPLPQRFCPPSELGNPQRTRVSTFPQRRRLSEWDKLLHLRQSYISTDSCAEPGNHSSSEKAKAESAKPASAVTTGFGVGLEAENPKRSVCEPFREAIELGLSRGRDATAIWHDLAVPFEFDPRK